MSHILVVMAVGWPEAYVMSDNPHELEEGWVVVMRNGLRLKVHTEVSWQTEVTRRMCIRAAPLDNIKSHEFSHVSTKKSLIQNFSNFQYS